MNKTLAIYGAGGFGREIAELAKQINDETPKWNEFIFIVDSEYIKDGDKKIINDIEVISFDNALQRYGKNLDIVIALGEPAVRERVAKTIESVGWTPATLIHPDVYIPKTTKIGKGVVIQRTASISCNVTINDYAVIQFLVHLGHDCFIEEGSVISPSCTLAGGVHIGKYTFLGMNCCVIQQVSIGDYTVIGMSSSVYKDIGDEYVAIGNPARILKKNEDKKVF